MSPTDALTNFVDQLNAPVFPTLEDFNASSMNEALKWTDLVEDMVYQHVLLIHSIDHQPFCLSRKLIDPHGYLYDQ